MPVCGDLLPVFANETIKISHYLVCIHLRVIKKDACAVFRFFRKQLCPALRLLIDFILRNKTLILNSGVCKDLFGFFVCGGKQRIGFLLRLVHQIPRMIRRIVNHILRLQHNAVSASDILGDHHLEIADNIMQFLNFNNSFPCGTADFRARTVFNRVLELLNNAVNSKILSVIVCVHRFINLSAILIWIGAGTSPSILAPYAHSSLIAEELMYV